MGLTHSEKNTGIKGFVQATQSLPVWLSLFNSTVEFPENVKPKKVERKVNVRINEVTSTVVAF